MEPFVDHLQILPMPFQDGVRQPDGQHRPGGLGMATLSDLLNARGWTARVEDMGFDKSMPETRLAEAFARSIFLVSSDRTASVMALTLLRCSAM